MSPTDAGTSQGVLDGIGPRQPLYRKSDPWTSKAAGTEARRRGPTQRQRVFEHLFDVEAATDDEVAVALGISAGSAAKRRLELEREGLVEIVPNAIRMTRYGCPAKVWRCVR